eukprot:8833615-Alexandrium_andersonii.AAC.1
MPLPDSPVFKVRNAAWPTIEKHITEPASMNKFAQSYWERTAMPSKPKVLAAETNVLRAWCIGLHSFSMRPPWQELPAARPWFRSSTAPCSSSASESA